MIVLVCIECLNVVVVINDILVTYTFHYTKSEYNHQSYYSTRLSYILLTSNVRSDATDHPKYQSIRTTIWRSIKRSKSNPLFKGKYIECLDLLEDILNQKRTYIPEDKDEVILIILYSSILRQPREYVSYAIWLLWFSYKKRSLMNV